MGARPDGRRARCGRCCCRRHRRGEDPPFEADDERTVYTVARQLTETGRIGQATYDAARQLSGDTGVVELVSLCGYYTHVSFLLGGFAVPLPPGAQPMWGQFSG